MRNKLPLGKARACVCECVRVFTLWIRSRAAQHTCERALFFIWIQTFFFVACDTIKRDWEMHATLHLAPLSTFTHGKLRDKTKSTIFQLLSFFEKDRESRDYCRWLICNCHLSNRSCKIYIYCFCSLSNQVEKVSILEKQRVGSLRNNTVFLSKKLYINYFKRIPHESSSFIYVCGRANKLRARTLYKSRLESSIAIYTYFFL